MRFGPSVLLCLVLRRLKISVPRASRCVSGCVPPSELQVKVNVDHKVKSFVKFLKKHAAIPFELPKKDKEGEGKIASPGEEEASEVKDEL